MLKNFSLNFLKGISNEHIELARLLWFLTALAAIAYAGVHLWLHKAFNIIEFGTGMAVLNGGSGGATAAKDIAVQKAAAMKGAANAINPVDTSVV